MVESVKPGSFSGPEPLARDGTRSGGGRFSVQNDTVPMTRNAPLASLPAIELQSMLALQAVDEANNRDRVVRRRLTAIIAALTDLQRRMLAMENPALVLNVLNELATDCPLADDPGLGAIMRAVVLRSRIEVARRFRDDQGRPGG